MTARTGEVRNGEGSRCRYESVDATHDVIFVVLHGVDSGDGAVLGVCRLLVGHAPSFVNDRLPVRADRKTRIAIGRSAMGNRIA